ncbi:FAD-dependent oxidoreductase [Pseudoscardovia suis]
MQQDKNLYDAVVIGGGPAGLTAGLYLARARYRVVVLEDEDFGGQITLTDAVVNYPGVTKASGRQLTATMRQQALDFGAELRVARATGIENAQGDVKVVHTSTGDIRTFGVILATGAKPRTIGFEGEKEYAGRGVAYCATCDGEFFTGREVLVVGGGFAAAEEAVFLTKYASHVTVLVREDDFTCDASVSAPTKADPAITVRYNTELLGVQAGKGGLAQATFRDRTTGTTEEWSPADGGTFGVFVFAGYVPRTELVKDLVELDEHGYVVTHDYLETSLPGVWAAGDLRCKNLRQVVTATADGAIAAVEAERYASRMSEKTGLMPVRPTDSPYQHREEEQAKKAREAATSPAPAPVSPRAQDANAAQGGAAARGSYFTDAVRAQLDQVFARMARPVVLRLDLDDTALSTELHGFMTQLADVSNGKVSVEEHRHSDGPAADLDSADPQLLPCVRLCVADGDGDGEAKPTGIAFHGVPSGHEFNSFVLALYNVAGPGQPLDDATRQRIASLPSTRIMLLVSLTCTMCPTTVLSAQRIASLNPAVTAEAYDIARFPELRDKYDVMSVPCIVITKPGDSDGADGSDGTRTVEFGKKTIPQMLDLLAA